jgi:hypothetical protein
MTNTAICGWLMDNADAPIRYRTARELLNDDQTAKKWKANSLAIKPLRFG